MVLPRLSPALLVAVLVAAACCRQAQAQPGYLPSIVCGEESDVELWGGEDGWESAPGFLETFDKTGQVGQGCSLRSRSIEEQICSCHRQRGPQPSVLLLLCVYRPIHRGKP